MDKKQRIEAQIQRGRQTEGTSGIFVPKQIDKDRYIWIESNIYKLGFREVGKQKELQENLNLDRKINRKKDRYIEIDRYIGIDRYTYRDRQIYIQGQINRIQIEGRLDLAMNM